MIISDKLQNLTTSAGVYQMLDKQQKIIYVGKAKNLKNRISSYFLKAPADKKTQALVSNIKDFQTIVTATETQALLLEAELIKQYMPRYNILLKDAKSYPYIFISRDKHPQAGFYRGNKKENYHFFGPYPSAHVVRDSLKLLKKIFKIRQCSNTTYKSRSRACLEYQIGLCSAPCVGKIKDEDYQQDSEMMRLFLSGKGKQTLETVSKKMQQASLNLDFELAAHLRDQLIDLRKIQEQHSGNVKGDLDIVSAVQQDEVNGVQVLFVRAGKQVGGEFILPKNSNGHEVETVLKAFLPLYYVGKTPPNQILINLKITHKNIIAKALNTNIIATTGNHNKHYLDIANLSAKENLKQNLLAKFRKKTTLVHLQSVLGLKKLPEYIECFDISHTLGEATVASCVVFKKGIPKTSLYRQFDIKNITPGDDYAAMNNAVFRRYSRLLKAKKSLPDVVFIDGGLGQLNQAIMVMDSIGIEEVALVGVAKGEGRKAGLETLIMLEKGEVKKINLPPHDSALRLVNHIRDESHRFAIKNHRQKRGKKRTTSLLEEVEGVGKKRRTALLNYFGGLQELRTASTQEIQKVVGISSDLATKIVEKLNT
jgi:excinuclease ABC subunit C